MWCEAVLVAAKKHVRLLARQTQNQGHASPVLRRGVAAPQEELLVRGSRLASYETGDEMPRPWQGGLAFPGLGTTWHQPWGALLALK